MPKLPFFSCTKHYVKLCLVARGLNAPILIVYQSLIP